MAPLLGSYARRWLRWTKAGFGAETLKTSPPLNAAMLAEANLAGARVPRRRALNHLKVAS